MSHAHPILGQSPQPGDERDAIHVAVAPLIAAEAMLPGTRVGTAGGKAYPSRYKLPEVGIIDPFLTDLIGAGDLVWVMLFPNTITSLRHSWDHPAFKEPVAELTKAAAEFSRQGLSATQALTDATAAAKAAAKPVRAPRPTPYTGYEHPASPGMDVCCPQPDEEPPVDRCCPDREDSGPQPGAEEATSRLIDAANEVDLSYQELIDAAKAFLDGGDYLCDGSRYMNAQLPDTFWDDFELVTGRKVPGDRRWSFFSCSC